MLENFYGAGVSEVGAAGTEASASVVLEGLCGASGAPEAAAASGTEASITAVLEGLSGFCGASTEVGLSTIAAATETPAIAVLHVAPVTEGAAGLCGGGAVEMTVSGFCGAASSEAVLLTGATGAGATGAGSSIAGSVASVFSTAALAPAAVAAGGAALMFGACALICDAMPDCKPSKRKGRSRR